jgi:sporulation protein YlmC with PRC-barrel domain
MATNESTRAGDLIGRRVRGPDGEDLGRIADLVVDDDDATVVAAIVTRGPWGRLLGYERDSAHGPWLLERFARAVLRRESRRVPWEDVRL